MVGSSLVRSTGALRRPLLSLGVRVEMIARAARKVVALMIAVQLVAAAIGAVMPKFSSRPPGGAYAFRARQRMVALPDWLHLPSPSTTASWDEGLTRLDKHLHATRDIPRVHFRPTLDSFNRPFRSKAVPSDPVGHPL